MTTTYQPLPITDADLAELQAAFPTLGITRGAIGADQYVRIWRYTGDVAIMRRANDPRGLARYLVHHPTGAGAGLWVFGRLADVIDFIAIGNHNQLVQLHLHGGSQAGAIVGDVDPVSPLVFT